MCAFAHEAQGSFGCNRLRVQTAVFGLISVHTGTRAQVEASSECGCLCMLCGARNYILASYMNVQGRQTNFGAWFQLNAFPQAPRSPTMSTSLPSCLALLIYSQKQHKFRRTETGIIDSKSSNAKGRASALGMRACTTKGTRQPCPLHACRMPSMHNQVRALLGRSRNEDIA